MLTLGEKVRKIRSKNAGPFWITIDIFCGNKKPASLQAVRCLSVKEMFVSQWTTALLEFEGALNDATKDA